MALLILALASGLMGPSATADAASAECLDEAEQHKAVWAISWAQWTRGLPHCTGSDLSRESLAVQIDLEDLWGSNWGTETRAWECAATGEFETAAQLLGGSSSLQKRHRVLINGLVPFAAQRKIAIDLIVAALGSEERFDELVLQGEALSTDEIYDLALGKHEPLEVLTARQHEVARLVAAGKKNREIAQVLCVSERTVENTLTAIRHKLNLRNKIQLANWFHASQQPLDNVSQPR